MGILSGLYGTPYAIPVFAACCVGLLMVACIFKISGHRLPYRALFFWVAVAGFISVTLTVDPQNSSWKTGARICSGEISRFPIPSLFLDSNQRRLNTLIAIPLGLAALCLKSRVSRGIAITFVCALPLIVEFTQFYVRRINRNCDATDAFDNLTGILIGLLVGSLISYLITWWRYLKFRATRRGH